MSDKDLSDAIQNILKRLNKIDKCPEDYPSDTYSKVQKTSNSLVVTPACTDNTSYGGDPRNSYRELRRYLPTIGIDTRIFSFGTIPIPIAINESRKSLPTVAVDIGSLDNCFYFELRKIIEPGARGEKVNAMVLMFRIFYEGGQQSNNFWVQIVLNHHRDAVLELNQIYNDIIPVLTGGFWSQPTVGREGCRVTYFEKRYSEVSDFKHEFTELYDGFKRNGLNGSYIQ